MNFLPEVNVDTLRNLNILVGCFFFAFTGSYMREVNRIYNGKQRGTKIHKIVIGTIIGMGLYLILTYKIIHEINIAIGVALNVICGLLGYEIFNRCSSIEDMKNTSRDIAEIVKNLSVVGTFLDKIFGSNDDGKDEHTKNPKK